MHEAVSSRELFIVAALAVAALFITAVVRFLPQQTTREPLKNTLATPIANPSPFFTETDTDGDGVPDWQEALVGSDPKTPDANTLLSRTLEDGSVETATDAVSERLMSQYLFLKDADAYTDERGERLGTSLADNLQVPTPFVPYAKNELRIKADTSKASANTYRKEMQDAVEPFLGITEPEFIMYARYIDTQDTQALQDLRDRGALYKQVAKEVMLVTVPEDAMETHLAVANSLAYFGAVLEQMVQYAPDPIASLALLHTYNKAEQYVFNTFSVLTLYYNTKI